MAVLLGLLAATSFSFGIVFQQRGTRATTADDGDWRFLLQVIRQPIWVCGALLSVLGWVLQTAAMNFGPLLLVQGLVICSLVITVPVGALLNNDPIDRRDIIGAVATVSGLVVFLVAGQPGTGVVLPSSVRWVAAAVVAMFGVAMLARSGLARTGPKAAAMLGCGAGLAFGFQGAVSKMFANEIGGGFVGLILSWSPWALIMCVVIGFAMQQAALKTGALAPAVAATNTTTLLVSVLLGTALFDERLQARGARAVLAFAGLALTVWGIATLTGLLGRAADEEPVSSSV